MPSNIILKKSSVTNKVPLDTDLQFGELAINYTNEQLFFKNSSNVIKRFQAKRIVEVTNQASPFAWNSDSYDTYIITAQAGSLTMNADSGSPVNDQKIIFRFKDNGTARALVWTTGSSKSFRAIGVTLPTTTVVNKTLYVGCIYNSNDQRWDVVAVAQEA